MKSAPKKTFVKEEEGAKKPAILSDEELDMFHKIARKMAIKFARINAPGNSTLSINELMNFSIRNSGMTCEDVLQELWMVGVKAYMESTSDVAKEARSFALNAMDWKVNQLAETIYRKKRGAKEKHISGEDADNILEGVTHHEDEG